VFARAKNQHTVQTDPQSASDPLPDPRQSAGITEVGFRLEGDIRGRNSRQRCDCKGKLRLEKKYKYINLPEPRPLQTTHSPPPKARMSFTQTSGIEVSRSFNAAAKEIEARMNDAQCRWASISSSTSWTDIL
jgi:hypothetical protein